MSEDLIGALVLFALGAVAIVVGGVYLFTQKVYLDTNKGTVTEIDVPLLGKLKTNSPAIGMCFLGLVLGYFGYDLIGKRGPMLVNFDGEVTLDDYSIGETPVAIVVGVTSGSLLVTRTIPPSPVKVVIPAPNSWQSYTAYAFALGGAKTKPAIIGANLSNPQFKLRLGP
ncbi:MAG: hypothetical protein U1E20_14700 [Methylocystis sp.]|uniref:hypothetical protein n=1 Tax=Methylocystis sp. TaxID=1911079 RepID=UPI00395FE44E